MNQLSEIEKAIRIYNFGYTVSDRRPLKIKRIRMDEHRIFLKIEGREGRYICLDRKSFDEAWKEKDDA